ncbi:phosphopantetheine-binding protein [Streptosporangium sp. CA-135522]|uniref:phosphopantetheine-binding protein n=1 Tax=Streptosporangium sp. CA-135522 TaxID=3240072 RepID=UPI003D8CD6E1
MQDVSSSVVGKRVEEIWRTVLDSSAEEPNATFFELGGRAISALRIVARIENELGIKVDVGDLFEHPGLDTFVRHVMAKAPGLPPVDR